MVMTWKRKASLVLTVVVAISIAATVFVFYTFSDPSIPNLSDAYSDELVVCRGRTSLSCARRAASRAGLEVAWADSHAESYLMAAKRGTAMQQLETDRYLISIASGVVERASRPRGDVVKHISYGPTRAEVLMETDNEAPDFWAASVVWKSQANVDHFVSVSPRKGNLSPDVDLALSIFKAVRYSE
jgi:hypothetical protein